MDLGRVRGWWPGWDGMGWVGAAQREVPGIAEVCCASAVGIIFDEDEILQAFFFDGR